MTPLRVFCSAEVVLSLISASYPCSINAVQTRVLKARFGWALANLLALLRQQLFVHRDLWTWLNEPFQPPPSPPVPQLPLALS